ncbi:MAG: PASTA domain-containing protein, partial [Methanothrix sp.]|nr:PASTA domain-containing protein [Methanothrix sp.]
MKEYNLINFYISVIILYLSNLLVAATCESFYCNMGSNESISGCNGTIYGNLTFVPGVNGSAINMDGTSYVAFTGDLFDSPVGSVSLWFKKNSADEGGGIMEIGQIGQANSIGVFYNGNNVYFEVRNAVSTYRQAVAPNVLTQTQFIHIVATWEKREDTYYTKLFINGSFIDWGDVTGAFTHSRRPMKIGTVGFYGNGEGVIDELSFFDWVLSDAEIYAGYVYSSNRYHYQPTGKPMSTGLVKLDGKTLTVNNNPFTIKGIGYQPTPIGLGVDSLDEILINKAIIDRDVMYLKAMNVNTIRLWAQLPYDFTLLNAMAEAGIYVIMAFEVPDSGLDYSEPATIASYKSQITDYVNYFKSHPAVLAWAIGNENNLHYSGNAADWYILVNELAKSAYEAEGAGYHPTIAVNGYMLYLGDVDYHADDESLNYVDIWGHNSYVCYDYNSYFCYYDRISAKPLILTEFGVDAYNTGSSSEYQDIQADWVVHEWEQIKENSLGGIVMEYSDEWWKRCGLPFSHDTCGYDTDAQPDYCSNEEWYGVMAIQDNGIQPDIMHPRDVYYALQSEFNYDIGSLMVTIGPPKAVDAGAKWRRAGTLIWRDSEEVESGIAIGSYTIEFKNLPSLDVPASQMVTIENGQTTHIIATYRSTVPVVVGETVNKANTDIINAGLVLGNATFTYSDTVATGLVISQNPVGGNVVDFGSSINLVISLGKYFAFIGVENPDFNGDGKADILWWNLSNGSYQGMLMNGLTMVQTRNLGGSSTTWQIVGLADFNADDKTDILWRNVNTGAYQGTLMNGLTLVQS